MTDPSGRDDGGADTSGGYYRDDYYRDEYARDDYDGYYADEPDVEPPPGEAGRRPRLRRALRVASKTAIWVFLAIGVAIGGFFLFLSRGPITFAWLAPTIADSLDELFGRRYRFDLAGASLANTDHGPTVTIDGLTVKSGQRVILAAPRAEVSVDFRSLLLGRIKPRRLEALDLELRLMVMPDGAFAVAAGTGPDAAIPLDAPRPHAPAGQAVPQAVPQTALDAGASESAGQPAPTAAAGRAAVLHQAAAMLRALFDLATSPDSAIGAIDRIGVLHGRLVIDDKTVGRVISYDDLSLTLDKGHAGMKFTLAATDRKRRWSAVATASGEPGARRVFDARLRDISIDEIALVGGFRHLKFDTDSRISFDAHFALGRDDHVLEANGRIHIGPGFFRLEDPDHEPVMIEAVSGAMHWDRELRQFVIAPIDFKAGGFDMALEGSAVAPRAEGEAGGAWSFSIKLAKPTVVAPERAREKSVVIERGVLDASYRQNEKKLVFDKFAFSGPDVNLALTGEVGWSQGAHVAYSLTAADTQIRALTRLWPTHVATTVRSWFIDHVPAGVLRRGAYSADFDEAALTAMRYGQSPPDKSVGADFDLVGATLTEAIAGLPPITGISGRAHVTGRTGSFTASSGTMETGPGRRLNVAEGRFAVADNMIVPTPATLDLRLLGSLEAVADMLALPSISPYASLPVDAAALRGQVDGRMRVEFEMGAGARGDRTQLSVDALASNVAIEHFVGKERLENATLNVVSDRAGLRVNGAGRLYGAPATLELRRPHGDRGPAQAQLGLTFDEAARARAGFGFAGVGGPIAAAIKTQLPLEDVDAQIELDLTRTSLENPLPGLTKPAGKPAKAAFVLAKRPEGMTLDRFFFDAGAAQAQGVIELSREGGFRAAKLSQARLSPGDDMRVEAQRAGDALKITVRGANIDARPVLRSLMTNGPERGGSGGAGKAPGGFEDIDLDLKSPIVTGHGKQILSNVDLKMERRNGRPRAFSLSGNFGRERLAVAMAQGQNGAPQLEISTPDGGSFLAFLDFYQKMDGGALTASVQIGQNRADGVLRVSDFRLKHEPTLRQLMAQGGADRPERGGLRPDPDSVRIGQLQSGFTWSSGRLSVREGVMSGPEIGLTFDGYIDFARETVDLGGSYVPAYALNSLLSNVPVLNVFITGGQNEGIFALNYRLSGSLNSPVVTVNPLSVIAPGLMRKIMGIMDGSVRPVDRGR